MYLLYKFKKICSLLNSWYYIFIVICVKSTQNIWWFQKYDLPLRKINTETYEEH